MLKEYLTDKFLSLKDKLFAEGLGIQGGGEKKKKSIDYVYDSDGNVTTMTLHNYTSVTQGMFAVYSSTLLSVDFSDCPELYSLPKLCFQKCTYLESVTLPPAVKTIGENCFIDCTSLIDITLPDTVTTLGGYCFKGCTALTEITIPENLTSIEGYCFQDCTGLLNVEIAASVINETNYSFYGCTSLEKVWLRETCTTITIGSSQPPFFDTNSACVIYLEADSVPSGFETKWNYYDSSTPLTVVTGQTTSPF